MTTNESKATEAMVDVEGEPISPHSNVLPKGATQDQIDVHWFFNWAYGEMIPQPTFSIFDQALMDARCSVGTYHERVEFTEGQLRAAARARAIDRVLAEISQAHVRALQRWTLAPTAFAEPLRETFGRLAGVALRMPSAKKLGSEQALIDACKLVLKKEKGPIAALDRHRARIAIETIDAEAAAALADALNAFLAARCKLQRAARRDEARQEMALFERALSGKVAS